MKSKIITKTLIGMLFYSFFKSLVGKDVIVELKNDLSICGTLHSVDQFLNIKLTGNNLAKTVFIFIYSILNVSISCPFLYFCFDCKPISDISVTDSDRYPHMLSVKNCFIRGSVVR